MPVNFTRSLSKIVLGGIVDLLTNIVILVSAAAMVFVFTVAQALERRSKGLPVRDASGYGWTKSLAYVAIIFGVVAGLIQIYKAGQLNGLRDILPVVSGTSWLIALASGAFKRR